MSSSILSPRFQFMNFSPPQTSELKFIRLEPSRPTTVGAPTVIAKPLETIKETPKKPLALLDNVSTMSHLEWFFVSGIKVQRNDGSKCILKTKSLFEQFLTVAGQKIAPVISFQQEAPSGFLRSDQPD